MAFRIFRVIITLSVLGVAAWLFILGGQAVAGMTPAARASGAIVGPMLSISGGLIIIGMIYFALWADSRIRRILENIFAIPELLAKIGFTIGLLCIYRIGFHVALPPGIDITEIQQMMHQQESGPLGQALALFSMFTGGSLSQSTLFGLGIMPYISASIIFTLLVQVIPSLEKLQKEGPVGQKKIHEYTRYLTVALCVVQSAFWMSWMRGNGLIYPEFATSWMIFAMGILGLTAGTVFLMWLGEQIDEYGIGNGISLLIMAGIVARVPWAIREAASMTSFNLTSTNTGTLGPPKILFLVAAFVFVVAGAILITQAQRRIPIQQAKHTRGRRIYGGQRHYMPLRVNHGGVMPIIFASSLMIFPNVLFSYLSARWHSPAIQTINDAFHAGSFTYAACYIGLIYFFAYFWTTVQFRPKEMSEQLRDYGSFIPGLRPGKRTADYLERVMERITYCGAAFLAVVAVLPMTVAASLDIPFRIAAYLGGTGLLIVVSVTLDLVQRIEANLVMRNYGGFLGGSTRIKGAYA